MKSAGVLVAFASLTICFHSVSANSEVPETCQPSVSRTAKSLYNLRHPSEQNGPAVGSLIRTETETFSDTGLRQRVEWINPDGSRALTFVELYAASPRPYGALYVEEGELEPTLEAFSWSDNGRVKTVEYRKANGEVTGRAQYFYDDENREIERRYGVDGETFSSSDKILYEGRNERGYSWSRKDGSASSTVEYKVFLSDAYGNWLQRSTIRDGLPTVLEVRSIEYLSDRCTAAPSKGD